MSINVTYRSGSSCKYVEIFTHHVGSIGAPSRTVFIRGTNTKPWEVPKVAGRNTKANVLQKGSAGFNATIDQKKSLSKWCLRLHKVCRLNSLWHQYKYEYMEYKGESVKYRWSQTSAGWAEGYWHQSQWQEFKQPRHVPTWTWLKQSISHTNTLGRKICRLWSE
jgi:hypothetical protein